MIPHGTEGFREALEAFEPFTREVVDLAARLCAEPGVTVPHEAADLGAVARTAALAARDARDRGLCVVEMAPDASHPYPLLLVTLPEHDPRRIADRDVILLVGHLDVVPPSHAGQFLPALEDGDLYARGAADMKAVVATWLVWMGHLSQRPGPRPPLVLLLSCCEENGSAAPHHAGSALRWLAARGLRARFAVVGERTGELEWMPADTPVGPICKENRAWRWLRAESPRAGLPALLDLAGAVRSGRERVLALNEGAVDPAKKARQPGVRSGWVCSFAHVSADAAIPLGARFVSFRRASGESIHAAAASAASPTLLERFASLARAAEERFGKVYLGGVRIGEDGNYNSTDGSGTAWLAAEADPSELAALAGEGLEAEACDARRLSGSSLLGLDVRELMDHREPVAELLAGLGERLPGFTLSGSTARPPWRCPSDLPDLVALEEAYAAEVGHPSPDLVKLHGNDGGSLAALLAEADPEAGARAPAVVFGQVGARPHGPREMHRCASIGPYARILDGWLARLPHAPSASPGSMPDE